MSRSGTDSPYRPTPNREAKELTSRSPTRSIGHRLSHTVCVCLTWCCAGRTIFVNPRRFAGDAYRPDCVGLILKATCRKASNSNGASPTGQADIAVTFSSLAGATRLSHWATLDLSGHLGVRTLPTEVDSMRQGASIYMTFESDPVNGNGHQGRWPVEASETGCSSQLQHMR